MFPRSALTDDTSPSSSFLVPGTSCSVEEDIGISPSCSVFFCSALIDCKTSSLSSFLVSETICSAMEDNDSFFPNSVFVSEFTCSVVEDDVTLLLRSLSAS